MKYFNLIFFLLALTVLSADEPVVRAADGAEIKPFVDWLLEDGARLEDVRFAAVAEAVSGREVLPVDPGDAIDAAMLELLERTLDAMLSELGQPEHPIHSIGRVNEISRHIEDFMLERLNGAEGYICDIPPNVLGRAQRSGYPDLRLIDEASGRIFYIDPKVFKEGSERSTFRTFYFEPKRETNKILDDASHLIIGIAHGGKVDGQWQLENWQIIDLIDFRVRLKAEFQASNRDLYKSSAVLLQSEELEPDGN